VSEWDLAEGRGHRKVLQTLAVPEMVFVRGVVTLIWRKMAMLMRKPATAVMVMMFQKETSPRK